MTEELKLLLGQCLAVGFDGPVIPEEYEKLVKEYKIGNTLLFKRNVKSYEQLRDLCQSLTRLILDETGHVPFIMSDEECGGVSRIGHIAAPTPCAMATGATGDPENAYMLGKITGEELRACGINMAIGPVLDCYSNPDNSVIGNRSYGKDPQTVTEFGLAYKRGLEEAGVFPCAKHFPGHGDTAVDSHLAVPVVEKSEEAFRETELVSFKAAIDAGIEAIMTAHIVLPAVDPERVPSTVSKKIMTSLLREELGFEGLLLTDGMEMNAVMNLYGIEDACRRALNAGCDICLVCHSAQQAASTMEYLGKAIENGTLDRAVIEERAARVLYWKEKIKPPKGTRADFGNEAQRAVGRQIMNDAIQVLHAPEGKPLPKLGKDTLVLGLPARAASLANDEVAADAAAFFAGKLGCDYVPVRFEEGKAPELTVPDSVLEGKKNVLVFLSRLEDALPLVVEQAKALTDKGLPVIAVSLSTARLLDALPDTVWKVAGWQYNQLSIDALWGFFHLSARDE
ncbi:MAG: beta-N-acetylhexosaminidase [Clostridia bacterium]|nr:beta-N-acetylhexosaminidase [Clostridia bacterium]